MISVESSGSFKKTEDYLARMKKLDIAAILNRYGQRGVIALSSATPVDSGETKASWYYKVVQKNGFASISWHNSHVVNGVSVVILLEYGHATGTGGYVQGHDFINPAIRPIMDQIAADVRKVVTSA